MVLKGLPLAYAKDMQEDKEPVFDASATLDLCLAAAAATDRAPAVVVPMLLASAFHARVDIPAAIAASGAPVLQADVLGEDPALLTVLGQRLAEHGVSPGHRDVGVIVAAVGSSSDETNARTASVGPVLAAHTAWVGAEVAFATGSRPTLADAADRLRRRGATRLVVAPWFLAHGTITDRVAKAAGALDMSMTAPLGAHNLVAATLLDRYDETLVADTVAA